MNHSAALLRLLEPAVRPAPTAAPAPAGQPPIEQRSFDSLLAEVKGIRDDATTQGPHEAAPPVNPLGALGRFAAIENASLRGILGSNRSSAANA